MAEASLDITAFKQRFPKYAKWSDKDILKLANASQTVSPAQEEIDIEEEYAPVEPEFTAEMNKTDINQTITPNRIPNHITNDFMQAPVPNEPSPNLNALITSLAHGGSEFTHGITGPIMESLPESTGLPEGSRELARKRAMEQEWLRENYPNVEMLGNIGGKGLVTAPLNVMFPGASGGLIARGGNNALAGLLSGLSEYGDIRHRLEQGTFNAGGGLLFPELLRQPGKAISKSTAKLYNFAKGLLPEKAKQIIGLGEQFDVPVYAPDVSHGASKIAKAGRLSEKTVINTVPKRMAQQEAAQKAAEKTLESYKNEMLKQAYASKAGMEKLHKIAATQGKRAKAAQEVLRTILEAGEDWNYILKTSGNVKLLNHKLKADELYARVGALAKAQGNLDLSNIVIKLDAIIKKLNKFPEVNKNAIGALKATRKDLVRNTKAKPASTVLNAQGNPVAAAVKSKEVAKKLSFDELREIRSALNDKISDFYTGKDTLIGKKGVKHLMAIRSEIEKEMENFATKNGPELKGAWETADKYYKENLTPYKQKALVNALNKEKNPDEIFKMFVVNGGAENDFGTGKAVKLYKALNTKGRAAVRYGIIKNAAENATDGTGNFSIAKFATSLEKLEAARGVFFRGADKMEIDGLTKLMRHVQRAGQVVPPETGVQTLGYALAASTYNLSKAAPIAGVTTLGASVILNILLTNPIGRNFLLAASKLPDKSPKWAQLASNIGKYVGKVGNETAKAASTSTKKVVLEAAEQVSGTKGYGQNKEEKE